MKSTLAEILEVEKNARKRLAAAEDYRNQLTEKAQLDSAEITRTQQAETQLKLEALKAKYERVIAEKKAQTAKRSENEIRKAENFSKGKIGKWADELYKRVLDTPASR